MTTKGVQIKPCDLARPIASPEDFASAVGIKKESASCIEGVASPYVHNDLANNLCYHYALTVITEEGESLLSEENDVHSIPIPFSHATWL